VEEKIKSHKWSWRGPGRFNRQKVREGAIKNTCCFAMDATKNTCYFAMDVTRPSYFSDADWGTGFMFYASPTGRFTRFRLATAAVAI
jgi:hypothetical protein